jgi:hypothetical protein
MGTATPFLLKEKNNYFKGANTKLRELLDCPDLAYSWD